MSTCFANFHPNLVIGGTYSGQIVLWDNRSTKRTPVQRTPLSAAAHTVRYTYNYLHYEMCQLLFVRNLVMQASLLQQKHWNSAHESRSGTPFMCGIVMLLLYLYFNPTMV